MELTPRQKYRCRLMAGRLKLMRELRRYTLDGVCLYTDLSYAQLYRIENRPYTLGYAKFTRYAALLAQFYGFDYELNVVWGHFQMPMEGSEHGISLFEARATFWHELQQYLRDHPLPVRRFAGLTREGMHKLFLSEMNIEKEK